MWQMVDAIVIPIMSYQFEGWRTSKEETNNLQSIFNEALKTIIYLPQGTSITKRETYQYYTTNKQK